MPKEQKSTRDLLYDIQSEESLLSHACKDPKILSNNPEAIEDTLTGERKALAETILSIASKGEPLIEESFRLNKAPDDVTSLFMKLSPIMPSVTPNKLIEVLRDFSARREIATVSSKTFAQVSDPTSNAAEAIEAIEIASSRARSILQGHKTSGGVRHIKDMQELLDEVAWRAKNPLMIKGQSFGFPKIEKILDGLQPAKLYLVGARPSVGKTSFAGDIAIGLAERNVGTIIFSAEMSDLQLRMRLLATLARVNPTKSKKSTLTVQDLDRIRNAILTMRAWNMFIDDTDRINIEMLRSRARRAVKNDGVGCIIVDYIQLIRGVEPKSRTSKKDEVGEVSGALKALSKELSVPVIALAQLRRSGQAYNSSSSQSEIPKPTLESLKESGDLEQDADTVILLHRDVQQNASQALAIIAKNRSGSCGEVELEFANDTTSFSEKP